MIKARNIIKSYQNGESRFQVLKDISLDIEDNDFVVILGASGSGKSTFLNVISGLERPDSGKVFYDGKDITALSDNELTALVTNISQIINAVKNNEPNPERKLRTIGVIVSPAENTDK